MAVFFCLKQFVETGCFLATLKNKEISFYLFNKNQMLVLNLLK